MVVVYRSFCHRTDSRGSRLSHRQYLIFLQLHRSRPPYDQVLMHNAQVNSLLQSVAVRNIFLFLFKDAISVRNGFKNFLCTFCRKFYKGEGEGSAFVEHTQMHMYHKLNYSYSYSYKWLTLLVLLNVVWLYSNGSRTASAYLSITR